MKSWRFHFLTSQVLLRRKITLLEWVVEVQSKSRISIGELVTEMRDEKDH